MRGDAEAVQHFLDAGEDVEAVSRDGNNATALSYAAGVTSDRGYEAVKLLLDHKADPNHPHGPARVTPLIRAIQANSPRTAELLLARGADKALTDRNGKTASDWASERKNPALTKMLGAQ
jgi:ankyrin repeat protein